MRVEYEGDEIFTIGVGIPNFGGEKHLLMFVIGSLK